AAHAMHQAVDALSKALISPDVIKACALASRSYGVYADNPMKMIEQQVLGTLQGRIRATMATQNIDHPVLNEIGLTIPEETGALPELQNSPAKRMQAVAELKEKRQRLQQKGAKS
ncbi:NAD-dependent aldehyde dehydrogenase, partial [Serratia nevei]|nr:NAD-dependent aldehyde dehydrogenase [Serratia nevei]MDK5174309.1 NAD-dependent aldehyde dehydrogenase [Serratia nevei]MDK5705854.1 NAD-dependent aldehyde dehydrogenase [Serratia nevei]MDK5837874.1 NAD-dependent aldehyde dehydrogenase [Serratia nevei]